jgi:protease-4
MKRLCSILITAVCCLLAVNGYGQPQSYYSRSGLLMAPPGAFHEGLTGFVNPANLGYIKAPEFRFHWSTEGNDASSFDNWGLFLSAPSIGFGVLRQHFDNFRVTNYQFSLGAGDRSRSFGIAYNWHGGDENRLSRERRITLGSISRPCRYISLGLLYNHSLESGWREGVAELGLRPLGSPLLTLFADGALEGGMKLSKAPWSAGAVVEVASGINLVGRYFENESYTFGFSIDFGHDGIGGQAHYDSGRNVTRYSYSARLGGMRSSVFPTMIEKDKRFLHMNMKGTIGYNKFVFFDSGIIRLMDILNNIQAAIDDPRVAAIALNLSGMRVLPEHAWEIREQLRKARTAGKKVIIFFDMAETRSYHLASVADAVVMDPEGWLMLPGEITGRTFLKGTLDKLGLGFDEWRFFKYKSALEDYSLKKMSEADAQQRQDFIDDVYELIRDEICQERGMSHSEYDHLIDESVFLLPNAALQARLVDTLARWSDKAKVIKNLVGKGLRGISARRLLSNSQAPSEWGPRPRIAVVYGLGVCAMDSGIRARWLEKVFINLAKAKSVKAVVFRVDSPGGEALASDLVAEALKKCAGKKPVIVSQGQVAASGGYHISMYGDTIVAGPGTVTGSIGVIGGWVYDKGFGNKLGMTSDFVKRGKHADVGFGIRLPFLGLQVPARNLTPEERSLVEKVIREFYDNFVEKVAAGRNISIAEVKKIAEGHFYSGIDGKEIKLVDEIGGMVAAMAIAKEKAGIKRDEEYDLIEIPKYSGWFRPPFTNPFSISSNLESDPVYQYLKMVCDNPGYPLPMLLPGTYPSIE